MKLFFTLLFAASLSAANGQLLITEIMYNTPSTDDEWVEIYNNGSSAVDISGYTININSSAPFTFPAATSIAPGQYFTIALGSNGDGTFNNDNPFTPDFSAIATPAASTSDGNNLVNSTASISLVNSGTAVATVTYDDGSPWPTNADGDGPSLELVDYNGGFAAANWTATADGGTPGAENTNALLPVKLTTFTATAQNESVLVQWQTAQEVNNDYFTLERSLDGKAFETIGMVQGNGTTDAETDYRFVDAAPATGVNYYRLTQTDYDGTSETFAVRSVTIGAKGDATVFPNPVRETVMISFPTEVSDADLQIHDLSGRLVLRQNFSGVQAKLDLSALNAGSYLLRVNTGAELIVQRLVKL